MNNAETKRALDTISSLWPHRPLDGDAMGIVGSMIAGYDFGPVMAAIKRLASSDEWFHVSKLLKLLSPPVAKEAREAFQVALRTVRLHAPGQRDANAPALVRAAVRRLGGWGEIGRMNPDDGQWNEKRWIAAWEEVAAEVERGRPLAELTPPTPRRSIAPTVEGQPAKSPQNLASLTAAWLTRNTNNTKESSEQ